MGGRDGAGGGRRMRTLLLDAEAALEGGSEAVHGLPRAADPLAHREDRAPQGPHASRWRCCTPAPSSACPGGWGLAAGRRARAGGGLMVCVRREPDEETREREAEPGRQWLRQRQWGTGERERGKEEATRPTSWAKFWAVS
jgi:hypothetical protein